MAHRLCGNVVLVGIGIAFGAGWSAFGEAATRQFWHEGRTVEHSVANAPRKPLGALVTAWPDQTRTGLNGSCPMYGTKALDTTTSLASTDGRFKLMIDQSQRTYTVVYCLNDFVPRVDFMSNRKDGTPVVPTPAELWPAKIDEAAAQTFDDDVERVVLGSLNNLSYLMTVDDRRFQASIEGLASGFSDGSQRRAASIRSFREVVMGWRTESPK
jgi:hypothetical protein